MGEWLKSDVEELLRFKDSQGAALALPPSQLASAAAVENECDALHQVVGEILDSMDGNQVRDIAESLAQSPGEIPYDYDRKLLGYGRRALGRDLDQSERLRMRNVFRETLARRHHL